jgi:hypothetical protein
VCWLIASFIDDLRVGGDPGGNLWSPSPPSSMNAAQIEATRFAMKEEYGQLWGGESSCLSAPSGPNIALMFALRHARRFSAVANKATTIDAVQKLEHEHSRLLRVVKKRIDDRKHLASNVLRFSSLQVYLLDGFFSN